VPQPEGPYAGHRTSLGQAIRGLRQDRGLTLRDLADRIGVSPATLSGIENGHTGVSTERVAEVAQVLGVAVERLFSGPSEPTATTGTTAGTGADTGPGSGSPGSWREYTPLHLDAALAGALSSFLEFGYHGATMRTIAERANLSVPGLYHYYPSKQDMLVALLDLTMADLRIRTDAALAEGGDALGRFSRLVECLALFHTHRRELAFVGASEMRSLEPAARARVGALRVGEQRLVDAEVEAGVQLGLFATDRPHDAARAVATMCTALAQWFRAEGPASAEEVAAQYVDFALGLVRSRVETGPIRSQRVGSQPGGSLHSASQQVANG